MTAALTSKSPYTRKRYQREWDEFLAYCWTFKQKSIPASPKTVHDFLKAVPSYSIFKQSQAAINFFHREAGYDPPCTHPSIKQLAVWYRKFKPNLGQSANPYVETPFSTRQVRHRPNHHMKRKFKGRFVTPKSQEISA